MKCVKLEREGSVMNILYMGYFCNEDTFNMLVTEGSQGSHARQQLEKNLLNGLIAQAENNRLEIVSYLPLVAIVKKQVGDYEKYRNIHIKYLWCNKKNIFSVLKTMQNNIKYIKQWSKGKKNKLILMYSNNPIHIIPAFLLRRLCNIKVVTLCSEVSVFRRTENIDLVVKLSRKISSLLDNAFDGYIVLTRYMNEMVNKKVRPNLVMEGISNCQDRVITSVKNEKNAILYAGGLTKDNGLLILLAGFQKLQNTELELWICGDGPLKSVIRECEKENSKIKYFGLVENKQVRQMEQEVKLLINPRFSNNEFTKYSFPSKTIEYLSSGTPTILTRLQGIPEEYFNYAYVLENENAEGVTKLLEDILKKSPKEQERLGNNAREYVLNNKNSEVQARRIYKFLEEL